MIVTLSRNAYLRLNFAGCAFHLDTPLKRYELLFEIFDWNVDIKFHLCI